MQEGLKKSEGTAVNQSLCIAGREHMAHYPGHQPGYTGNMGDCNGQPGWYHESGQICGAWGME